MNGTEAYDGRRHETKGRDELVVRFEKIVSEIRKSASAADFNGERSGVSPAYMEIVRKSLGEFRNFIGAGYAGIWLVKGWEPEPVHESGNTADINNAEIRDAVRRLFPDSGGEASDRGLWRTVETTAADGSKELVYSFKDSRYYDFGYLVVRGGWNWFSSEDVSGFCDAFFEATHVSLLESELLSSRGETESMRNQFGEAVKRANRDGLTGLLTKTATFEVVERYVREFARTWVPVGIGISDIDDFKKVNDRHGHLVGDKVLKKVADIMNIGHSWDGFVHFRRQTDHFGRFGWEEMVFVLHNTTEWAAKTFAERVREIIASVEFESNDGTRFRTSVSIGVTEITAADSKSRNPEIVQEIIERADKALYVAKRSGKNRTVLHSEIASEEPNGSVSV